MKIEINNKPFAIDEWYDGKYIEENIEYEFTILSGDNCTTVTWTEETPENSKKIELDILRKFMER